MLKIFTGVIIAYIILLNLYYYVEWFQFSPKCPHQKSLTSHRHAAYKTIVLPFIEIYSIYLAMKYFDFSVWKAVEVFNKLVFDSEFYLKSFNEKLTADGIWISNSFVAYFLFGFFHYYFNDPYVGLPVWHKVFAVMGALVGGYRNKGHALALITILLWKPSGVMDSCFTMVYLGGWSKTTIGKVLAVIFTLISSFFRFITEPLILMAMWYNLIFKANNTNCSDVILVLSATFLVINHNINTIRAIKRVFREGRKSEEEIEKKSLEVGAKKKTN